MQGVNIMQFCKEYNAATQDKAGTIIPVEITVYEVREFIHIASCSMYASIDTKQQHRVPCTRICG